MKNNQKGFIHWVILAIIALALLKYFLDWDIFEAADSEQGRGTIGYIKNVLDIAWSYISAPVTFVWKQIVWPILEFTWASFQALLEQGREAASK